MTKEEAVYRLNALLTMCDFRDAFGDRVDSKLYEDTVAMAIEALEENESLAKSVKNAAELIRKLQKKNERIPCSERLLDDVSIAYENGYQQGKFEAFSDVPDTNVGKWITKSDTNPYYTTWWYECSECGQKPLRDEYWQEVLSDYCPSCGCRMECKEE